MNAGYDKITYPPDENRNTEFIVGDTHPYSALTMLQPAGCWLNCLKGRNLSKLSATGARPDSARLSPDNYGAIMSLLANVLHKLCGELCGGLSDQVGNLGTWSGGRSEVFPVRSLRDCTSASLPALVEFN
ncbi:predicted protein [Histoplasma capsulatum G186AR]|uniref:Uncharacterized protein n=1 Tax=Ajellomyces capsulatus (strain G186AR / H82 / ATCC MYA-2454 / RMSCC 2432) TaxID=447093 RepID=C0NP58_AJECG|nr:uncharacterized protein HCBG_04938 [Histoplasma capsulatum G186AR]EEH06718.1 predicted protein [Histoplasma capsulatum G186AR]